MIRSFTAGLGLVASYYIVRGKGSVSNIPSVEFVKTIGLLGVNSAKNDPKMANYSDPHFW